MFLSLYFYYHLVVPVRFSYNAAISNLTRICLILLVSQGSPMIGQKTDNCLNTNILSIIININLDKSTLICSSQIPWTPTPANPDGALPVTENWSWYKMNKRELLSQISLVLIKLITYQLQNQRGVQGVIVTQSSLDAGPVLAPASLHCLQLCNLQWP